MIYDQNIFPVSVYLILFYCIISSIFFPHDLSHSLYLSAPLIFLSVSVKPQCKAAETSTTQTLPHLINNGLRSPIYTTHQLGVCIYVCVNHHCVCEWQRSQQVYWPACRPHLEIFLTRSRSINLWSITSWSLPTQGCVSAIVCQAD